MRALIDHHDPLARLDREQADLAGGLHDAEHLLGEAEAALEDGVAGPAPVVLVDVLGVGVETARKVEVHRVLLTAANQLAVGLLPVGDLVEITLAVLANAEDVALFVVHDDAGSESAHRALVDSNVVITVAAFLCQVSSLVLESDVIVRLAIADVELA